MGGVGAVEYQVVRALLLALLVLAVVAKQGQGGAPMINFARLLAAFALVEGAEPGKNMYQITEIFLKQVNKIVERNTGISDVFTLDDRNDDVMAGRMVWHWFSDWQARNPGGTVYDAALAYNAGETGAKKPKPRQVYYGMLVEKAYNAEDAK